MKKVKDNLSETSLGMAEEDEDDQDLDGLEDVDLEDDEKLEEAKEWTIIVKLNKITNLSSLIYSLILSSTDSRTSFAHLLFSLS